jgi:hypothetical protein
MRYQLPLILALAACVENHAPTTDDVDEVTSALEQENGGLEMTDEPAMFADEAAFEAAAIETDTAVVDTMADDPTVTAIANQVDGARHRILIAWGRLPADPNADGRNWSGSLTVSRGAIVVGRRIGFEEATDRVLPRTSRDRVDFESATRPFADGLVLRVLDPDPSQGALRLRYASADGTRSHELDLTQLDAGPLTVDAGDGNRIVVIAARENDRCDHGFMRGRWVALRPNMGVYRGVVANSAGEPVGHVRGIWGQRRNGNKVMFGKLIASDGRFRGLLAGTYDAGHWHARWLISTGDHGVARGVYFDAPNARGGAFAGRWAETSCAQP